MDTIFYVCIGILILAVIAYVWLELQKPIYKEKFKKKKQLVEQYLRKLEIGEGDYVIKWINRWIAVLLSIMSAVVIFFICVGILYIVGVPKRQSNFSFFIILFPIIAFSIAYKYLLRRHKNKS